MIANLLRNMLSTNLIRYSLLGYHTAFLKAHYPYHYMSVLLSHSVNKPDKLKEYLNQCKKMGIEVLPPDINRSGLKFGIEVLSKEKKDEKVPTVDEKTDETAVHSDGEQKLRDAPVFAIRFGLEGIKGLTVRTIVDLISERESGGSFVDVHDVFRRLPVASFGKVQYDALIESGSLDAISSIARHQFHAVSSSTNRGAKTYFDDLHNYAKRCQLTKFKNESSSNLLFDLGEIEIEKPVLPASDSSVVLSSYMVKERERLGVYFSEHPIQKILDGPVVLWWDAETKKKIPNQTLAYHSHVERSNSSAHGFDVSSFSGGSVLPDYSGFRV